VKRQHWFFIKDMCESIQLIENFVGSMNYQEFREDPKTRSAVAYQLQIIGEAAKNIPSEARERYREVPWGLMARMRDKIAHFYFGIDYEIVWDVVKNHLPSLKPLVLKILEEYEEESSQEAT